MVEGIITTVAARHDQRRQRTDRKIMKTVLDILISKGVGAVTIEEVARKSGVAKTTIYRRYENANDLLNKLSLQMGKPIDLSGISTTHEGVHEMLQCIIDGFDGEMGLKGIGVVLTSDNAHLHGIAEDVVAPANEQFLAYIARGVEAGDFKPDLNVPFLFQTVLGSMLARQALSRVGYEDWVSQMTELLWNAIARP